MCSGEEGFYLGIEVDPTATERVTVGWSALGRWARTAFLLASEAKQMLLLLLLLQQLQLRRAEGALLNSRPAAVPPSCSAALPCKPTPEASCPVSAPPLQWCLCWRMR